LKSLIQESKKLTTLRDLHFSKDLFRGISKKQLVKFKQRLSSESLHEIKRHPPYRKYSLFAAFAHVRVREITDDLVELLIQIIHKIGARAERKVTKELVKDFKKVRNKEAIFCEVAEAAVDNPKGSIEDVIFPVASESTLKAIIKEIKSSGPIFRYKVQNVMRASYVHHYRRMIPIILDSLEFRSNNSQHRPVIDGIELVKQYKDSQKKYYPSDEKVPIKGVVRSEWKYFVFQNNRINRANYELALLDALRNRLRCKEIWVQGASKYCNPDEDLPKDFEDQKTKYFEQLNADLNPHTFVMNLENQMRKSLDQLNLTLPKNDMVKILSQKGGSICVSPFPPQEEPSNIIRLKREISTQWPLTNLLDILKETELRVGF
jgi:hypothetical protein